MRVSGAQPADTQSAFVHRAAVHRFALLSELALEPFPYPEADLRRQMGTSRGQHPGEHQLVEYQKGGTITLNI